MNRYLNLWAFTACLLAATPAQAGSKKQTYEFTSTPPGATVLVAVPNGLKGYKQLSCITPCRLKAKPDVDTLFRMSLTGHQTEILFLKNAQTFEDRIVFNKTLMTQEEADAVRKRDYIIQQAVFERDDKCNVANMTNRPDDSAVAECRRVNPVYPPRAEIHGTEGNCVVTLTVSAAGTVDKIDSVTCSMPDFVNATERAVMKWRFYPERVNGENVSTENVTARIIFKMSDNIAPSPVEE